MKISIIGGSGFVGTNLCRALLQREINFEIIDLKNSQQFPERTKIGDVRSIDDMKNLITGDLVINLAAVHRDDVKDSTQYYATNVQGMANIISVCEQKDIQKIIFTSTVAVYGFAEAETGENGLIQPFNDYGKSKYEAEELLRIWQNKTHNQLIIIRPTVIFGEGNRGNVYNLFKQIASGNFIMVGSGTNKKSMAYIGNVVAFLEHCISTDIQYGLYNYIDTPDLTMNELTKQVYNTLDARPLSKLRLPYWLGLLIGSFVDMASRISGRNLPVSAIRVKKFTATTTFSTNKKDLDDFQAPYELQEAIANTLNSEFISPDPDREIFYTE